MTLLDYQLVLGRHNIRPPHFASKVSYSASPQVFVAPYLFAVFHGQSLLIPYKFLTFAAELSNGTTITQKLV